MRKYLYVIISTVYMNNNKSQINLKDKFTYGVRLVPIKIGFAAAPRGVRLGPIQIGFVALPRGIRLGPI